MKGDNTTYQSHTGTYRWWGLCVVPEYVMVDVLRDKKPIGHTGMDDEVYGTKDFLMAATR